MPHVDDPRQPFQLVLDDLREVIREGSPGDKLPSSRVLAERHRVAPMTVQRALQALRDQGLIYSKQGVGSFIHSSATDQEVSTSTDLASELKALKIKYRDLEKRLSKIESAISA